MGWLQGRGGGDREGRVGSPVLFLVAEGEGRAVVVGFGIRVVEDGGPDRPAELLGGGG